MDVCWVDGGPVRSTQSIYSQPAEEAEKHVLALASLEALPALSWTPDLIHANDWQAAAFPGLCRATLRERAA